MQQIIDNIFSIAPQSFNDCALQLCRFQYGHNPIYKAWVDALRVNVNELKTITEIPFLPISFFKSHLVVSGNFVPEMVFESSGTTGLINSKHAVKDAELYRQSYLNGFRAFYGDISDWCIIGLLPSYLERSGSSLVAMVDDLIKLSGHPQSGFYLNEFNILARVLQNLEAQKKQTLVIGVTFALLDFAEQFPMNLEYTTIMETGGMKGRRKEMIRAEVHEYLKKQFQIQKIHSEYGMTELLSQGYSKGDGAFSGVPWMKVLIRDEDDPLKVAHSGKGLLNVIDLANMHSCSFIATDDVGKVNEDGRFEILGRMDNSDIRGCSLMLM